MARSVRSNRCGQSANEKKREEQVEWKLAAKWERRQKEEEGHK